VQCNRSLALTWVILMVSPGGLCWTASKKQLACDIWTEQTLADKCSRWMLPTPLVTQNLHIWVKICTPTEATTPMRIPTKTRTNMKSTINPQMALTNRLQVKTVISLLQKLSSPSSQEIKTQALREISTVFPRNKTNQLEWTPWLQKLKTRLATRLSRGPQLLRANLKNLSKRSLQC
jgi:hypothetical protein